MQLNIKIVSYNKNIKEVDYSMNRKKQKRKTMKRCLAIAMAAACVMSASMMATMSVGALPSDYTVTDKLSHNANLNKGTISVTDVTPETGLNVVAYQVLKWENGTGWVYTDTFKDSHGDPYVDLTDKQHPTAAETVSLSERARVADDEYVILSNSSGSTFTATGVEPGLYVVMVTGSKSVIYSPALVSLNLNSDLTTQNGTVAMSTRFDDNGNTAYVKSSTVNFTKKIVNVSSDVYSNGFINNNNKDAHGDVVPLSTSGTAVKFILDADIPEYPAAYFSWLQNSPYGEPMNVSGGGTSVDIGDSIAMPPEQTTESAYVRFSLEDHLYQTDDADTHFEFNPDSLKVYVKDGDTETEIPEAEFFKEESPDTFVRVNDTAEATHCKNYYHIEEANRTAEETNGYIIDFGSYFLKEYGGKELIVRYDATLASTAGINYDENQTTAILSYSIPDGGSSAYDNSVTLSDDTYHYTFASGTAVNGTNDTVTGYENDQTVIIPDIVKVGETAGESRTITDSTTNTVTKTFANALGGAQFTMTHNGTNKAYTSTSDANGLLSFVGLDTGTYTLAETNPPSGYALNTNEYTVPVAAVLDDDTGVMESYTIGNVTYAGTHSVTEDQGVITSSDTITVNGEGDITPIINTHLDSLPSTGGVGTIALTVGASVAMAGFLAVNVINRKHKKDEQE